MKTSCIFSTLSDNIWQDGSFYVINVRMFLFKFKYLDFICIYFRKEAKIIGCLNHQIINNIRRKICFWFFPVVQNEDEHQQNTDAEN